LIATEARNASLEDMVKMLRVQHNAKNDAVVPASAITSYAGYDDVYNLVIEGMGPDGPAGAPGWFKTTDVFDEHLADKLGIPLAYLRRCRNERRDILDDNINGWISGNDFTEAQPDPRRFLVRTFTDPDGGPGIARGLMSDTYKVIDNLDVLMAALEGIRLAGVEAEIEKCQISERRMQVDVICPSVGVVAGDMLRDYRDPFKDGAVRAGGWTLEGGRRAAAAEGKGYEPGEEPMLWSGFQISNSELGGGAFNLTPRVVFSLCRNGLKFTAETERRVHLGGRLEEGAIEWSDETKAANLELIMKMTTDAIATWLSPDYLRDKARTLAQADQPLNVPAIDAIQLVGVTLKYTDAQQAGILEHFIRGGQLTSLGVVNAITSYAQTVDSPDVAYDLENTALEALAVL
jgi:hypothetical protein